MHTPKEEISPEEEVKIVHNLFKKNLRMLRLSESLTAKDLSERLGFDKGKRINDLEEGRVKPKFDDLVLIVDYFPITFNDLLEVELTLNIPSRRKWKDIDKAEII